ncbi:MAG: MFS transporter, partial [Nannocystaceae bacterium]|nr:MFS transporter [Nannocystaceae bacterium]
FTDRQVMLSSAAVASVGLFAGCLGPTFWGLVALWFLLGAAIAAVQTPMGRLLNRSVHPDERSGAFALQFSLSHACWLAAYGVAGWLPGGEASFVAFGTLGAAALGSVVMAAWVWRADDDVPRAESCGRVTGTSRCAER